MKIKHNQPKGKRVFKGNIKYNNKNYFIFSHADCDTIGYWWIRKYNKWMYIDECLNLGVGYSSASCNIHSVKAFRRRLKQWSKYMPKGTKFTLVSNFNGCDIYGII